MRQHYAKTESRNTSLSLINPKRENLLLEKYGSNPKALINWFGPARQIEYCNGHANIIRCSTEENIPTCEELVSLYGQKAVITWIAGQIFDLCEYVGARDKPNPTAIHQCALILLNQTLGFKATEILLFFWRCKAGAYGHFYLAADLQQLALWWYSHINYINKNLKSIENENT